MVYLVFFIHYYYNFYFQYFVFLCFMSWFIYIEGLCFFVVVLWGAFALGQLTDIKIQ